MKLENEQKRPGMMQTLTMALGFGAAAGGAAARSLTADFSADQFVGNAIAEHAPGVALRQAGPKPLCILSGAIPSTEPYAVFAAKNHIQYAKRHGYQYYSFDERLSGEKYSDPGRGDLTDPFGGGLMWQKLTALEMVGAQQSDTGEPRCRWMMWMDADAIFTNMGIPLGNVIHRFALDFKRPETRSITVILSREETDIAANFLNTGVFFLKNNPAGMQFIKEIGGYYEKYKDRWCPEQGAIQEWTFGRDTLTLPPEERGALEYGARKDVAIAPQRAFNSFRWTRQEGEAYRTSLWHPCDFIGHSPGLAGAVRVEFMTQMMLESAHCYES